MTSQSISSDPTPATCGAFLCFQHIKKPSPVGEGGSRQRWMRSYLKIENTSSVTLRVPPSPHWGRLFNFTANFADARPCFLSDPYTRVLYSVIYLAFKTDYLAGDGIDLIFILDTIDVEFDLIFIAVIVVIIKLCF